MDPKSLGRLKELISMKDDFEHLFNTGEIDEILVEAQGCDSFVLTEEGCWPGEFWFVAKKISPRPEYYCVWMEDWTDQVVMYRGRVECFDEKEYWEFCHNRLQAPVFPYGQKSKELQDILLTLVDLISFDPTSGLKTLKV